MNRKLRKWLIILEVVVFYLCLLNIISHARGPVMYKVKSEAPLLEITDFLPFIDIGVPQTDTALPFLNTIEGRAIGYQGKLENIHIDGINISFEVVCPSAYKNTTIIVDLYNYEAGYDSPEQEKQIILNEGTNNVDIQIIPEESAPQTAWLRLFTGNCVNYEITNLKVYEEVALPRITIAMVTATVISGIAVIFTAFWEKLHR